MGMLGSSSGMLKLAPPLPAALLVMVTPMLPPLKRSWKAAGGTRTERSWRRMMMSGGGGERAAEAESAAAATESDVVVQYVVVRRDLIDTWPMGSVVTQGCHASVAAIWSYKDDPHTLLYCSSHNLHSMHKVTLEVKGEPQIRNLSEKLNASGISHHLWIEQPENIPTCLATKPYPKSTVSPFFKKLKLCK